MSMHKKLLTRDRLQQLFIPKACWTIDELCVTMHYAAISIRRYLKELGYLSSFTHNSKWYTLLSIPTFNKDGIWFYEQIGFSKHGNLKQTILFFIHKSPEGLSAKELAEKLLLPCQSVLNHLYKEGKMDRFKSDKGFIYLSKDERKNKQQLLRLQLHAVQLDKSEKLSPHVAVFVLTEYIKNPQASFEELSRAVAKKQVIATPAAIAQLFEEHALKKTLK